MRVRIEQAQCVGNARCQAVAPELYPLNDDGYIDSTGFEVAPGAEKAAVRGAKACPERIIFVTEAEHGETQQVWPPQQG
jgi:ferredoxin